MNNEMIKMKTMEINFEGYVMDKELKDFIDETEKKAMGLGLTINFD